jgi:hypothetical protein
VPAFWGMSVRATSPTGIVSEFLCACATISSLGSISCATGCTCTLEYGMGTDMFGYLIALGRTVDCQSAAWRLWDTSPQSCSTRHKCSGGKATTRPRRPRTDRLSVSCLQRKLHSTRTNLPSNASPGAPSVAADATKPCQWAREEQTRSVHAGRQRRHRPLRRSTMHSRRAPPHGSTRVPFRHACSYSKARLLSHSRHLTGIVVVALPIDPITSPNPG